MVPAMNSIVTLASIYRVVVSSAVKIIIAAFAVNNVFIIAAVD